MFTSNVKTFCFIMRLASPLEHIFMTCWRKHFVTLVIWVHRASCQSPVCLCPRSVESVKRTCRPAQHGLHSKARARNLTRSLQMSVQHCALLCSAFSNWTVRQHNGSIGKAPRSIDCRFQRASSRRADSNRYGMIKTGNRKQETALERKEIESLETDSEVGLRVRQGHTCTVGKSLGFKLSKRLSSSLYQADRRQQQRH